MSVCTRGVVVADYAGGRDFRDLARELSSEGNGGASES